MAKRPMWSMFVISLLAVKALSQDLNLFDALDDVPTKAPAAKPKPTPAGPRGGKAADDFDLSDALDPKNDIPGGKDKGGRGGKEFSDSDLLDIPKDNDYTPDKGKGGRGGAIVPADNTESDTAVEGGTIAGIASAVAMALVGAVSSYISYQKKKLCFSNQQSQNSEYVKTENLESVVFQEPQVQQTMIQPPNAEPPSHENAL